MICLALVIAIAMGGYEGGYSPSCNLQLMRTPTIFIMSSTQHNVSIASKTCQAR